MDSSVSPKDEIWLLRVCHHISTGLYDKHICHAKEQKRGCDRTRRPLSSKATVLSSENLTAINSARIISITTRTSVLRTLIYTMEQNYFCHFHVLLTLVCLNAWSICYVNMHSHTHARTHTQCDESRWQ